jgi:iron(III) transport system substrate-binding protein
MFGSGWWSVAGGRRPWPLGAALAILAAVGVSACGGSSGSGGSTQGKGQTLTLYNAQHEQTTASLTRAFTKQTGIKVRVKSDDEAVLTAQLEQEAANSPADLFYTENSNWLQQLSDRKLLAKVRPSTLARIPKADNAANGDWLGLSGRFAAIIYNPAKIPPSQLPKSALDLADPKYKGKLELSPGETDFWPIVSSIARAKGRAAALDWLKGLKSNAGSDDHAADNETLVSDVNKGLTGMGLINHYYFYRLRDEMGAASFHAKLALFEPGDPGYVEDISAIGIPKSSKHQAAAQRFLAFMASGAGQRELAKSKSFEYPLVKGVAPNPALPRFDRYRPNAITAAEIGTGLDARSLLQEAGLL